MAEFSFEILSEIGVLSETPKGWRKELNLISFHGMERRLNMTLESGLLDMRKWVMMLEYK